MDLYAVRQSLSLGKSIYDIPLRVTFYARVSTDKDEQLNSLNNQIGYYQEFIQKCPYWDYVEGYYDEGITGTSTLRREGFLKMIEDGKQGKFDLIITKEISRFSRSTLDSIKYTQELLTAGIGVFFQNDNINTLHSDSELRLTIMSSIAQDEVRKLSERVKFGFRRSIAEGRVLGNDNIYGYTKQSGKLVVEPTEARIVKRIFSLYLTGIGLRAIGNRLLEEGITNRKGKMFGYSTIKRIIQNPKYKGYYCGNKSHKIAYNLGTIKKLDQSEWIMYEDGENVPQIIEPDIWERANAIFQQRSREVKEKETSYTNKFAYSKKIFCGEHNAPYYHATYKYKSGHKEIWQCKQYVEKGLAGCKAPVVYTAELDTIVRDIVHTLITDKAFIANEICELLFDSGMQAELEDKVLHLEERMKDTQRRKDRLLDLSVEGILTNAEFKSRNDRFNAELRKLEKELSQLRDTIDARIGLWQSYDAMRLAVNEEIENYIKITAGLVDSLLERIVVLRTSSKEKIDIEIKLRLFSIPEIYEIKRTREGSITRISGGLDSASVCSSLHI